MDCCRFVDYSDRPECLIELYNFQCVTSGNIRDARSVIPSGHFWQVELGDRIIAYIIDNRIEGIQGMLTIWRNKGVACLDEGEGVIWGDWLEDHKLLLTYEFDHMQDPHGMASICRIAYNSHGVRGKFAAGKFYTRSRSDAPTKVHKMREMRYEMS